MVKNKTYKFQAELWLYPSETAAWHFVSLPKRESAEIKNNFGHVARGWSSLPVEVTIGKSRWRTSIFADKKSAPYLSYLLPIKASIRRAQSLRLGDQVQVSLRLIP